MSKCKKIRQSRPILYSLIGIALCSLAFPTPSWAINDPTLCTLLMRDVPDLYAPGHSDVNLSNLDQFVELPLRAAVRRLMEMNLATYWSSANLYNIGLAGVDFYDGLSYSEIGLLANQLSPKNLQAIQEFFSESVEDARIGHLWSTGGADIQRPQSLSDNVTTDVRRNPWLGYYAVFKTSIFGEQMIHVYIPIKGEETAEAVSHRWLDFSNIFTPQEPIAHSPEPDFDALFRRMDAQLAQKSGGHGQRISNRLQNVIKSLREIFR